MKAKFCSNASNGGFCNKLCIIMYWVNDHMIFSLLVVDLLYSRKTSIIHGQLLGVSRNCITAGFSCNFFHWWTIPRVPVLSFTPVLLGLWLDWRCDWNYGPVTVTGWLTDWLHLNTWKLLQSHVEVSLLQTVCKLSCADSTVLLLQAYPSQWATGIHTHTAQWYWWYVSPYVW